MSFSSYYSSGEKIKPCADPISFPKRESSVRRQKGPTFNFKMGGGGLSQNPRLLYHKWKLNTISQFREKNFFSFNAFKSTDLAYFSEKQETISIHVLGHTVQQKREICSHIILFKDQEHRTVEIML